MTDEMISRGMQVGLYEPTWINRFLANRRAHDVLRLDPSAIIAQSVVVPDVSFYQDDNQTALKIDFAQMKQAGAQGVIIRGGQNVWPDEDFVSNMEAARAARLPRGSYWFFDPRVSATGQADRWADMLTDMPELDLWLDAEYSDSWGGAYAGWTHLYDFLERLNSRLPNARISIYTGYYWWFDHVVAKTTVAQRAYFRQYPLALAWYTTDPALVNIPQPWSNDDLRWWQWTAKGNGLFYGVESLNIDLNYFNGDSGKYKTTFNLGGVVPPPVQTGDTMIYINKVVGANGVNGRVTAASSNETNKVGIVFKTGDVLICDAIKEGPTVGSANYFARVRACVRAGASVILPVSTTGEIWAAAWDAYQSRVSSFSVESVPGADLIASVMITQEHVITHSSGLVETFRDENHELPKV